jgi:hypothetical protein
MSRLTDVWNAFKTFVRSDTGAWILVGLVALALSFRYFDDNRFADVCAMAREALDIETPAPGSPEIALTQIERKSFENGQPVRELWRWQQLAGPKLDELCGRW